MICTVRKTEIFFIQLNSREKVLHKMRNLNEKSLDQDRLESQVMLRKEKILEAALTEMNNKKMRH